MIPSSCTSTRLYQRVEQFAVRSGIGLVRVTEIVDGAHHGDLVDRLFVHPPGTNRSSADTRSGGRV